MNRELSEDNKSKLNSNGLYRHKPELKYRENLYSDNLYWCCNWIFKPVFQDDGQVVMEDTYWCTGDGVTILLTDKNIKEFEFIFDKTKVRKSNYDEIEKYDEKDVYKYVATDSGGYSCGSCVWINKDAKPLIEKEIKIAEYELDSAKKSVEWRERELKKLLERKTKEE